MIGSLYTPDGSDIGDLASNGLSYTDEGEGDFLGDGCFSGGWYLAGGPLTLALPTKKRNTKKCKTKKFNAIQKQNSKKNITNMKISNIIRSQFHFLLSKNKDISRLNNSLLVRERATCVFTLLST